jgi:predicted HicB family RNase H-like nuclease
VEHPYTYRLEWSSPSYLARCLEIDSLLAVAPTAQQALERLEEQVHKWLQENEEFGEPAPKPLSERDFSGRFMVRTSRSLHARMAMEAIEQGVSLNQWVVQNLAARKPSLDW